MADLKPLGSPQPVHRYKISPQNAILEKIWLWWRWGIEVTERNSPLAPGQIASVVRHSPLIRLRLGSPNPLIQNLSALHPMKIAATRWRLVVHPLSAGWRRVRT